ncbi:uncharacterized protein FFC1_08233 [Fusarium fujikuroi]|nr:uncharacterized protein FFC1_08233 [Fusarium fujikuroi]
MKINVVNNL